MAPRALDKAGAAMRALAGRVADLGRAAGARAVLIHREAALVGPPILEWLLSRLGRRPLIFDLDDAIWVPYASPTYGATLSRLLKAPGKTHFTLAHAARVIAGNPYVADYARRFNLRTDVIPTVVDTDGRKFAVPRAPDNATPVLGWIGTHSSLQYLRSIVPALQKLAAATPLHPLRVVGARLDAPGLDIENLDWQQARELHDFQSLDIGLYPLVADPWSLGKSGFKAVQYMACAARPVVASPVGVTVDMIEDGANGFLAPDEAAWIARLEALLDDRVLRRRMGDSGRVLTRSPTGPHASPRATLRRAGARHDGHTMSQRESECTCSG